jgi:uncharacterized protein
MRVFIFLVFVLCVSICFCQQSEATLNEKIVNISFENHSKQKVEKRKLLSFKKKAAYLNPLNYLSTGFLFVYQNIFSEQIQANCTYETSCSEYAKLSIQKYGFFIGALKGFNQLSECAPNAIYEHSPVYINTDGKIINHFEQKIK